MFDILESKCGCGEEVRYSTPCGRGACNKYARCLSYKEQELLLQELIPKTRYYELMLTKITEVNAMDYEYRAWAKEAIDKYKDKREEL